MILKEGYKSIAIALVLTIILFAIDCEFLGFIGVVVTAFITYSYRNAIVGFIPKDDTLIISPIAGKVTSIDKDETTYKVYIDVGLCDTHLLNAPKSASFEIIKKVHGLHLCHNTLKAKEFNTQSILGFDDIKLHLLSGICNKEYEFSTKKDVLIGERIGLFFHGVICVEIPKSNYELNISLGEKLQYETQIAKKIESN
jgi:hypothetical protein